MLLHRLGEFTNCVWSPHSTAVPTYTVHGARRGWTPATTVVEEVGVSSFLTACFFVGRGSSICCGSLLLSASNMQASLGLDFMSQANRTQVVLRGFGLGLSSFWSMGLFLLTGPSLIVSGLVALSASNLFSS